MKAADAVAAAVEARAGRAVRRVARHRHVRAAPRLERRPAPLPRRRDGVRPRDSARGRRLPPRPQRRRGRRRRRPADGRELALDALGPAPAQPARARARRRALLDHRRAGAGRSGGVPPGRGVLPGRRSCRGGDSRRSSPTACATFPAPRSCSPRSTSARGRDRARSSTRTGCSRGSQERASGASRTPDPPARPRSRSDARGCPSTFASSSLLLLGRDLLEPVAAVEADRPLGGGPGADEHAPFAEAPQVREQRAPHSVALAAGRDVRMADQVDVADRLDSHHAEQRRRPPRSPRTRRLRRSRDRARREPCTARASDRPESRRGTPRRRR